jgi:hypothetical protein
VPRPGPRETGLRPWGGGASHLGTITVYVIQITSRHIQPPIAFRKDMAASPTSARVKLVRRLAPDRSQRTRRLIQGFFILLNL